MLSFKRYFIWEGDQTTAGGQVTAAPQQYPSTYGDSGIHATFEGDPVWCTSCKRQGLTKCVPPYRLNTGPDGRQRNLDGDLCVCGCVPPPRLVALRHHLFASFTAGEVASMPGSDAWLLQAGHSTALTHFDQHFVVNDKANGQPVSGFAYGLKTDAGEHHAEVYEDGATVKAYSDSAGNLTLQYLVQTSIGIRP